MINITSFKEKLDALLSKFEKDKIHYLSKGYLEAQVRIDFINPFFEALGWDIENEAQKPPHERDVIVELSPELTGRPDYNLLKRGFPYNREERLYLFNVKKRLIAWLKKMKGMR